MASRLFIAARGRCAAAFLGVYASKSENAVAIKGGSGYQGELMLEVVGATGTGVANLEVYIGSIARGEVTFTRKGKAEALSCGI